MRAKTTRNGRRLGRLWLLPLVAACDLPTGAPLIDQRWKLPVEETRVTLRDLLPPRVTEAGSVLSVDVDPIDTEATLGELCGDPCSALDGLVAPAPPFSGTFSGVRALPADVASFEVIRAEVDLEVTNGLDFDPLENGGTLRISVSDGTSGTELGFVALAGPEDVLPARTSTTHTLTLDAGTVTSALRTTADIVVTGGQIGRIDVSDRVSARVSVRTLEVASATIRVFRRVVRLDEVPVGLNDVESELTDRIQEGAVSLDVRNPFDVDFQGTLRIGPVSKPFTISGRGPATVVIREELRSFVGVPGVTLSGSGTANGDAVTIEPGQVISIDAEADVVLRIG